MKNSEFDQIEFNVENRRLAVEEVVNGETYSNAESVR